MYQSIYELPTQVTSSLSESDSKVWMDAFNKAVRDSGDSPMGVIKAREAAWRACKDLPSSFSFCITASVEDIDKDREVIDIDSIAKNMDEFISYGGNVNYDHSNYNVGTIWAWEPMQKDGMRGIRVWGNVFGGDTVYDQMRQLFVKGVNSLSVAGAGTRGRFECDSKGCYTRRGVEQLMEISLCKVPANRHATLQWFNEGASLTKSAKSDGMRLNITEYTLHRDETTCPILGLRKSLREKGFDAHARDDGVHIPMSEAEYSAQEPVFKSMGLISEYSDGDARLESREYALEKAFRRGYEGGWIDEQGRITPQIRKGEFCDLFGRGLLESDGLDFYLGRRRRRIPLK